jgi:hypothetical protein
MEQTLRQPIEFSTSAGTVIAGWLRTWSRLRYPNDPLEGRPESEQRAVVAIYYELLSDIPIPQLDAACRRVTQRARFFPKPADIRDVLEEPAAKALQLDAENAWDRTLRFVQQGMFSGIRELPPQVMHAARAAGGLGWIESCPPGDLQWAKKRFIEDYKLIHETRQAEHLLSDGEAKKIIRQLAAQSEQPTRKALVPIAAPADE